MQTQSWPRLLSKEQAAKYLSISTRSLDRIVAEKRLRPVMAGAGCWRIKIEDLDAYVNSLEYASPKKVRGS